MDLLCPVVPQFSDCIILQLSSPDNRVIAHHHPTSADHIPDGAEFHGCHQVTNILGRRRIASPIARRVFDQRAAVGKAGLHGITDGMTDTRIGNARNEIGVDSISAGHRSAALLAGVFDTDPLIDGGRIAGVYPEKGANMLFLSCRAFGMNPFMVQADNLRRSEEAV